ncbi:hypothetical protein [Rhizobium gallicum]|nr:hypothetical protein [Rhizobium gallicum]
MRTDIVDPLVAVNEWLPRNAGCGLILWSSSGKWRGTEGDF